MLTDELEKEFRQGLLDVLREIAEAIRENNVAIEAVSDAISSQGEK